MKIIDLTHPLHPGMPTFPVQWHPYVEISPMGRYGIEGRVTHKITIGTHTGTHVDAPAHFIAAGGTIEDIPMELLGGPALLLDLSYVKPKQPVDRSLLEIQLKNFKVQRLILYFNWSEKWGTMEYFTQNPFITPDAAQYLIDSGIRILGMDTPQVDSPEHGRNCSPDSPIHKIMLSQGCYFVENLTNLGLLKPGLIHWTVAPLKIYNGDGAPCRTFAMVDHD